ncbi:MAG TPA: Holliday junction resolvase RuvX [Haloplasmataceae bacterium]
MRVLGLDLGTKTVGIAISDTLGLVAQGLETFTFKEERYEEALNYVVNLIRQYEVTTVVLGYPKNMNGTVGERGKVTEWFKDALENRIDVKVILWDERMTTMIAEQILLEADLSRRKRKKVIDKMAAVVILQSYLDAQYNKNKKG